MDIAKGIAEGIAAKEQFKNQAPAIQTAAELVVSTFKQGHKALICGNGGSAADAQHIAAEFVGRFKNERRPLPAIALTTDTSILTAIGNDYGYDVVFSRQVEALAVSGDVLIALSTSGNSPNVLKAVEAARKKQMKIVGFTGGLGGKLKDSCDVCIVAPGTNTARIQECHMLAYHLICEAVDEAFA